MSASKPDTKAAWIDPDAAPELTDAWFESADLHEGGTLVRRGRPRSDNPKRAISIRVDADVLERYKALGPGWQARMNEALRKAVGL